MHSSLVARKALISISLYNGHECGTCIRKQETGILRVADRFRASLTYVSMCVYSVSSNKIPFEVKHECAKVKAMNCQLLCIRCSIIYA